MKSFCKGVIPVVIAFAISSCSPKIEFTQAIREQYKLGPDELKKIQFYTSGPLVLKRGSSDEGQKSTEDGKLIVTSGKNVEQVYFKTGTLGAVEEVLDTKKVSVAFEDGAGKYLVFGSDGNNNGYYKLQALSWTKNGQGKINYGDQTYYSNHGSEYVILLFKMKSLKNFKIDEKVVKGKKVR